MGIINAGYIGNKTTGNTIDFKFTTLTAADVPTTLAGTPAISVYKDNGTTESTAGVTLTVDFDSRTGLNHVRITTASDSAFYTNGSDFYVVITTGTVNAVSAVGSIVASFSLHNRFTSVNDMAAGVVLSNTFSYEAKAEIRSIFYGSADGGTLSTLIDATQIGWADNFFNGCLIYIPSYQFVRPIIGFDGSTGTYTFASPSNIVPGNGDSYEVLPAGSKINIPISAGL